MNTFLFQRLYVYSVFGFCRAYVCLSVFCEYVCACEEYFKCKKTSAENKKTSCSWHRCLYINIICNYILNAPFITNLVNDFHSKLPCSLNVRWFILLNVEDCVYKLSFYNLQLTGCGFVGRHLVTYFINNGLVSHIRVVDKAPPLLAFLNHQHMTAFNDKAVEFYSANLINQGNFVSIQYFHFVIKLEVLAL